MLIYKSAGKQMIEERRENERLRKELDKARADVEYLAMMTDVDLDDDTEEEETEAEGDENGSQQI